MSEFTYNCPDEKKYFAAILKYLDKSGDNDITALLKGCSCSIRPSGTFSRQRWNAYFTEIMFYVPVNTLDKITGEMKIRLLGICDKLMPAEVGFDVMSVDFSVSLDELEADATMVEELEETVKKIAGPSMIQLPKDILDKGKEMSEVYLYLYCVENSVRIFVETVGKKNFGDAYFAKLSMPISIKKGIQMRREQESRNQWLRVRGESDIYYLDFKDLGTLITHNWDIFKAYFPDQPWISSKIDELGNCRNLIAHNSYVEEHEKNLIKVYYTSIIRQINSAIESEEEPW